VSQNTRGAGELHDEVLAAIGRRIVSGAQPTGSVLTLDAICTDFDISRTPQLLVCRGGDATPVELEPLTGYDCEIRHLVECLTKDRRPLVNLRDAAVTQAVLDAERVSAAEGRVIHLAEQLAALS